MKVKLPSKGTYKCVLLTSGNDIVFRSGPGNFHSEVMRNAKTHEPELESYRCNGGGRMTITDDKVVIWGYSVDYGKMDYNTVNNMLSEYCKENGLQFENRSGQGY